MAGFLAFLYGLAAYLIFLGTFLYAIAFVTGVAVPKTIDTGPIVPMEEAIAVNLLLLSLFAVRKQESARDRETTLSARESQLSPPSSTSPGR